MKCTSVLFVAVLLLNVGLPAWGQAIPVASPEEAALSSERLDDISEALQGHVDEKHVAGVTALIAHHGKIGYFKSFGKRDVDAGDAMQNDAIYRIYSMSKPITSVAVMMLFEEGRFSLDAPASTFMPELGGMEVVVEEKNTKKGKTKYSIEASKSDMTIRDLLRHTSGLSYGSLGIPELDEKYREEGGGRRSGNLEDFTKNVGKMPLRYEPATRWNYSLSTDVLGRFVEVVSGMNFDEFLAERIFEPLGMTDTGFHVPKEKIGRFAAVYGRDADMTIRPMPAGRSRDYSEPPSYFSGGGGLVSTTEDYFKFCQMMLNGGELNGVRILSRKTVELMTRDHLGDIPMGFGLPGFGFGLGFLIFPDPAPAGILISEGSYSWGGAASTSFWIDPVEEIIGIFMIQIMPEVRDYGQQFRILTYRALDD